MKEEDYLDYYDDDYMESDEIDDKYSDLPYHIGLRKQYGEYLDRSPKINGTHLYRIITRIIESHINKKYEEAYNKYREIVPESMRMEYGHWWKGMFHRKYRWYNNSYYIDKNYIIRKHKESKRIIEPIVLTSPDYTYVEVHKHTGHKKSDFNEVYAGGSKWNKGKLLYYEYGTDPFNMKPIHERYTAKEKDFIQRTLTGWKRIFYSRKDPHYKKCLALYQKLWKKKREQEALEKEKLLQEAIKKKEEQLKLQKLQNETKIIKHGFDLKTSFRK